MQVLLKAKAGPDGLGLTDSAIADAFGLATVAVSVRFSQDRLGQMAGMADGCRCRVGRGVPR